MLESVRVTSFQDAAELLRRHTDVVYQSPVAAKPWQAG